MRDADGGDRPNDQLHARAAEGRTRLWLYLEADRRLVVAGPVAAVFLIVLGAGLLLPSAGPELRGGDAVGTLFQGFLTATITGVTLVLTLSQLVLSQEPGAWAISVSGWPAPSTSARTPRAPSRRRSVPRVPRSSCGRSCRRPAGGRVTPATPWTRPTPAHDAVTGLTGSLIGNAEGVADDPDGAQFAEFDVLSAALNFNHPWKIFAAQRIRETEALNDDATAALDPPIDTVELFGPAREHFKTLYLQWEPILSAVTVWNGLASRDAQSFHGLTAGSMINLSRGILAAALPALLAAVGVIAFFDPAAPVSRAPGIVPIVALTSTVSVLPFLVLLAYVLRIVTVTKHTPSIGPFIPRGTEGAEEVERESGSR